MAVSKATVELPLKTLAVWWKDSGDPSSLQAGGFLEIGFYGDDRQHVVAVRHPRLRWEDSTYPNEDDPDRYLRAAV